MALKTVSKRELEKFLRNKGFYELPGQHKHRRFRHERTGEVITVPISPRRQEAYTYLLIKINKEYKDYAK